MRIMMSIVLVALSTGGCKGKPAAETVAASPPPADQPYNPYKNVMPSKVKADVEKINQQHEDKLDKEIESSKTAQ